MPENRVHKALTQALVPRGNRSIILTKPSMVYVFLPMDKKKYETLLDMAAEMYDVR